MNFGMLGAPLAFAVFGLLVGLLRRYVARIEPGDLRLLFVPYLVWMSFNLLYWDLDNYIAHTVLRAGIPMIAILLLRKRVPRASVSAVPAS